jgi:hypothetical protein
MKRAITTADDPGLRRDDKSKATLVSRQVTSGEADFGNASDRGRRGVSAGASKMRERLVN